MKWKSRGRDQTWRSISFWHRAIHLWTNYKRKGFLLVGALNWGKVSRWGNWWGISFNQQSLHRPIWVPTLHLQDHRTPPEEGVWQSSFLRKACSWEDKGSFEKASFCISVTLTLRSLQHKITRNQLACFWWPILIPLARMITTPYI